MSRKGGTNKPKGAKSRVSGKWGLVREELEIQPKSGFWGSTSRAGGV